MAKRSDYVHLRISPEQKRRLRSLAEYNDVSMSEYLVALAMSEFEYMEKHDRVFKARHAQFVSVMQLCENDE